MSVSIDSEEMQESIQKLKECLDGIDYALEKLDSCHFPSDQTYKSKFNDMKTSIKQNLTTLANAIENTKTDVEDIKEGFEEAERRNYDVAHQISTSVTVSPIVGSTYGNSTNTTVSSADTSTGIDSNGTQTNTSDVGDLDQDSIGLDDTGVETNPPTDTEINDGEQNIDIEENVPKTQVEAVIELIYGEDTTIPDDTKERIAEAIAEINKTEILDGLDEDIANQIRSEIVQDYLDGELELEGIEAEDLQEYIDSQPSIKIQLEMNEALASFDSLIESGVLTKEQIKSVIEENIEIHDDQEFEKLYIENGGIETEVSNIESFYDPETQKVHIRNTVESQTITASIVTVLDDVLFYNEETGEVSYKNVDGLNQDANTNMGTDEVDSSSTNVENADTDVDANMGDNQTNSSSTNVEDIDADVTIEMPDSEVDATFTNIGKIGESDTTINVPNQEDNGANKQQVQIDDETKTQTKE